MIRRTHWQTILGLVLGSAGISYVLLEWWASTGRAPVLVSAAVAAVILAFSVLLFALGRSVRRFVLGRSNGMTALRAFRVFVLAKASIIAGAVQLGFFAANAVVVVGVSEASTGRRLALTSAAAALACAVLVVVGLVVEWFCRVPPVDEDQKERGTPA